MKFFGKVFKLVALAGVICMAVAYFSGDTSFLSVGGVVSALVGMFGIYVVYKLLWSAMGIYLNFIIIGLGCLGGLYFVNNLNSENSGQALFSNEDNNIVLQGQSNNNQKIASNDVSAEDFVMPETAEPANKKVVAQAIADAGNGMDEADLEKMMMPMETDVPVQEEPQEMSPDVLQKISTPQQQNSVSQSVPVAQQVPENSKNFFDGIFSKISGMLFGNTQSQQFQSAQQAGVETREAYNNINPFDYPSIKGHPRVMRGSVLLLNGYNIRLYGIEAPYPNQTCADNHGRSYACGTKAITWLQNWINNREVTCYILGEVVRGWATGICLVDNGKYDLAAVITSAGWAVAYTKNTDVYVPYEREAAQNKRGLWGGTFYKPWDWYRIQTRKVKITVKDNSSKSSGGFDFWGLF